MVFKKIKYLVYSVCATGTFFCFATESPAQCINTQTRGATVFQSIAGPVTGNWVTPANAEFNDANITTLSVTYSPSCGMYPCNLAVNTIAQFEAKGFGFSIPAGAAICGVQLTVICSPQPYLSVTGGTLPPMAMGANATLVNSTTSMFRGPLGQNGSPGSPLIFGNSSSVWSVLPLSVSDVNDPNFGFRYLPKVTFNSNGTHFITARIGYVEMTVTYDTSLPVDILNFTAENKERKNIISWTSSSETNNVRYHLERSVDAKIWEVFKTIEVGKDKLYLSDYTVTDTDINSSVLYYKLSHESQDGTIEVIGVRSVEADLPSITLLKNINVQGNLELLSDENNSDGYFSYSIINTKGGIVKEGMLEIIDGKAVLSFDGEDLGLYYLNIHNTHTRKVFKFIN